MLGWPLWSIYLAQRYFSGKSRPGWLERWGRLPDSLVARADSPPRIWVHAVSAGEVVAAVPIVREIRALLQDHNIVFSVTTPAGMEMAEQQARQYVDAIFYFPFDLPWVARSVVRQLRPRVFVSLESELWPNVLHELKRSGAVTVMVNGRITERSYRRIVRFGSGLFRWMLSNMDRLQVQSEADASRVRSLGGDGISNRIEVVGNSKFDQEITQLSDHELIQTRARLKFPPDTPIFVAGSTRSSEEEAEVIRAYKRMRERTPALCLLIAPRHIARATELLEAMHVAGLEPVRKTQLADVESVRHLILDTMGELADVYALAAFAFVGNSFPPTVNGGGQNLVQPLAHGKPVFFGPETATIRSEVDLAVAAGVGFEVRSAEELAERGRRLLENDAERAIIGQNARALIMAQQGVSRRYAQTVADLAGSFRGEQA